MTSEQNPSLGVAIITLNAEKHLPYCLAPLLSSPLKPKVLVLDSSSCDNTLTLARKMGAETYIIPRMEFNHGTTRELARHLLNTDIVVMMTQDAYPKDPGMLEKLIHPIQSGQASVSYARQLPHDGADFFESFPRTFNYPPTSQQRSIKDIETYGVYTFFCSNSCAAYRNRALDEIGGFKFTLFGEDTIAVSELLRRGHQIAYVAEAEVQHSHRHTLGQEFRRNFDIGLSRNELQLYLTGCSSDERRGIEYLRSMTKYLINQEPHLLPYAYLQTLVKWFGYRLGRLSTKAPAWFKKIFSSQRFYWDSTGFLSKNK